MIRRGISGGLLSVVSLINKQDRTAMVNNTMIRTSSSIREAAKIGLQSLYADADEVLEKYKDFDIIKEMKSRKGANLLWVKARAIDADICNTNGDYFSKEELTKEVEYQGKKMPAYKTFEGVPIYTNHKNDDIEEAKGMVVYSEWDDEENCVYCVFFIDEDAYPDIARGIRQGYIHDVSMGCFVKGTLVLTKDGYKPIEAIQESDLLVDANGNLTKILNRQIKIESEKIYNIQIEGGYSINCTKEHPILSIDSQSWKKRVKRNKNSTPQRSRINVVPDFIETKDLKIGDMLAIKTGGEIIDSSLTVSQAKLLGYFAAEGNYLKYKNKTKEVEFTFALDEKETLVHDCISLFKEVFNVEARVYERIPKNTISVRVYSPEISEWFKYHVGQYSYGKSLSKELRFANFDVQRAFVCSWIKGDGCVTHKSKSSNGISGTTCSLELAKDITYILTRLGFYHKIYARFENKTYCFSDAIKIFTNSKGFDGRNMSFDIELPSYEASQIADDCGFICNTYKHPQLNKNYTEGYILRKIKKITEVPFNGPVYNFETESHTYTVSNIGVHNCSVDEGICSICGNKATTEKNYCDCLQKYKGKMHPSGKRAFEYNYGIKFIELSCVGDGAFESCEILELYDQDELLAKAQDVIKTAQSLNSSISLAASFNEDVSERREVEGALRQLQDLNRQIIRIAQTAGTLVGGQLMGGGGAQNATVVKILQGLGIDPSSQLNILDLVNLSLNFLEVAVLNLFSRKDNIDLAHVAKLTKAMGELQNTLQDMIDDGVETGGQRNTQPMIPPQGGGAPPMSPGAQAPQGQGAAPAGPPVPQMQAQPALFEQPSVGTMISPFSQQPYVMPLGGGVAANTEGHNTRFVWASTKGSKEIEEVETKTHKLNKIGKLAVALDNLREACNISKKNNNEEIFTAPQKDKNIASSGDKKIMDHFKKIAQDLKKANSVALAIDIKLDDQQGNRVVLSTDKGIKGFHKGQLTNWSPNLSDTQLSQMENGDGYRVAADLLKDFSNVVKTAELSHQVDHLMVWDENLEPEREETPRNSEENITENHSGQDGKNLQEKLEARRKNKIDNRIQDEKLNEYRTDELVKIVTTLAADAKKGLGLEPLEEMLHPNFGRSVVPGREVMSNVVKSVAKTCLATKTSPEKVLTFLTNVPTKELGGILKLARLGSQAREYNHLMSRFAQPLTPMKDSPEALEVGAEGEAGAGAPMPGGEGVDLTPQMPEEAIKGVADSATPDATEGDIIKALEVIKDNFTQAVDKLNEILDKSGEGAEPDSGDDMKDALGPDDDVDQDAMKGAVTGLSLSGEETGSSPEAMVGAVNDMPVGDLSSGIDKARSRENSLARAKSKTTKTASKKNLSENVVGWLADMANHYNVSSEKIALAAKLFCSYEDSSKDILRRAMKTAEVRVVDETTHATTIYATLDDIGTDVKDASFNEKFRDYAVDLLGRSGYEVDPSTFALTDIDVSEDGMVTGKVSSRSTKAFIPEEATETPEMGSEYVDPDRAMKNITEGPDDSMMPSSTTPPVEVQVEGNIPAIMSASAKAAKRLARMKNVIKVAQGLGLPGAPTGGGVAGPVDPAGAGGMAGGGADLGLGSLTGASPEMGGGGDSPINDSPEPGNKAPWGTICPQCGSKDVDVANGEGNCNSCNAQLKFKFIVEVAPAEAKGPGEEAMGTDAGAGMTPPPPVGGPMGAPEAGMGGAPGTPPAATPAPATGAAPAMASSYKVMTRVAYRTSADVYASALSDGFNKKVAQRLPVGMICPACGSREASKKDRHTYCYDCGTLSVSEIKGVKGKPGELEAVITWI